MDTNNFTLQQFSDDCNDIELEVYYAIAKSKSVFGKFEVMIFFCNFL